MAEAVEWGADGTPRSPRFDDIYRPAQGGLAQARQTFLAGCGLPAAWGGAAQWRVLETGFGLGLNFLATWLAWRDDAARPRLLHFAAVEAWPVSAADLVRSAATDARLTPLAAQLAQQWFGLTPGLHRLAFDEGRVLLTLAVGDARDMLRGLDFQADSVYLDGFDPARNPRMWELPVLKGVARLCRRGARLATWTAAGQVRRDLATCGFAVERQPGVSPKRHNTIAWFEPGWALPAAEDRSAQREAGQALVVGAGLAGAATAASLARRGWQVEVLDAAGAPASGASALPAGLMAPYQSPDDNPLSRLARAGIRMTWQEASRRLTAGVDWGPVGALERRIDDARPPPDLGESLAPWTCLAETTASDGMGGWWHAHAAWIKPAALVRAWLADPGVSVRTGVHVASVAREGSAWSVRDAAGDTLGTAPVVVLCAANGTAALAGGAILTHPVRGQVTWGLRSEAPTLGWPAHPVHGHGHLLPAVPMTEGLAWMIGATYSRDDIDLQPRPDDQAANMARLAVLAPDLAPAMAARTHLAPLSAWTGLRCVTRDRRPLAGWLAPGLGVSTALGSRGLTFAVLAAELLAAQWHGEPLPLETPLAAALSPGRFRSR